VSSEAVKALRMLGLTEYEARAYITLLELGEAEASEISRSSGIPRTRIYDVLSKLESRGLIQGVRGSRPILYMAMPPSKALNPKKEAVLKELEDTVSFLNKLYEEKAPKMRRETWMWLLRGVQAYNAAYMLIKEASETLFLRIAMMPTEVIKNITRLLRKSREKGVRIYVTIDTLLLPKFIPLDLIIDIDREFRARAADIFFPFNGIVSDFKDALMLYVPLTEPDKSYGFLVNVFGEISELLRKHLEEHYESLPTVEEKLFER